MLVTVSINAKQLIAVIWTFIAIALALAIVLAPTSPYYFGIGPWQISLLLFFVALLVMTLPVYLLLALWHCVAEKSETD